MRADQPNAFAVTSPYPLLGLNVEDPSTQIDPSYATVIENMFIRDGRAFKRSGYYELIEAAVEESAEIMAMIDFELLDGSREFVIVTSKQVLRFNTSTEAFVDISPSVLSSGTGTEYTITAVDTGAEKYTIGGNHADEFLVGSVFEVVTGGGTGEQDGHYHVVTATDVASDTEIVVSENITDATVTGKINAPLILAPLSGDYVDLVVATDTATHRLFITNGTDEVLTWNGTDAKCLNYHVAAAKDSIICKSIDVFFDHLVMGNVTIDAGSAQPKTVLWSDVTDFDELVTGGAGEALIPALDGEIVRIETLGDRLVIYSDNTIAQSIFVGLPVVFSFEVVIEESRLISGRAIIDFGPAHLYCGQENIYLFDGSRSIRQIGNHVRTLYKADFNHEFATNFFTFNDTVKRLAFIVVPISETKHALYTFDYDIFDLKKFRWTRNVLNDLPTAFGFFFRRTGNPDWDDAPPSPTISWEDDAGPWGNESEQKDFPQKMVGAKSQVFVMSEAVNPDDTVDITATYETVDFVVPVAALSHLGRWLEIEADLAGVSVDVSYSIDQGANFTTAETIELSSTSVQYRIPIDVVSRTLRVRFRKDKFFALRWVRVWTVAGGPR